MQTYLITFISPIRKSVTNFSKGNYQVVTFHGSDGLEYHTYIFHDCKNYNTWVPFLQVGNKLTNLKLKNKTKKLIDADSVPELVEDKEFIPEFN